MTPGRGASPLPKLQGRRMVTDGGLETDLIFHYGVDLPHFAAFPLLDSDRGRALAGQHARLASLLPPVPVLGGCCGTDTRHVAALWAARSPTGPDTLSRPLM